MDARLQVSFVMATHNRGAVAVDCLRRVLACGLPASQFEVIVADNASTDGTADLIRREVPTVRLIELARNYGPVAKNLAIKQARGEIVVLLDDDAYPLPGAVMQMVRHFAEDARLGAAVFDVTLPDGAKEGSAYPDVFIGAGTGVRRMVLQRVGLLPADFFMQAEEYDLSLRIWAAGFSIQRFWDMPLMHLKSPGARIGQRTTRLDVRNNLYWLARYIPAPLCHELAADWLARYWLMALARDAEQKPHAIEGTHKKAFLRGAAEGLAKWTAKRQGGRRLVSAEVIEQIFKFDAIRRRLERVAARTGLQRIAFSELGKNQLAFHRAACDLGLEIVAIADGQLGGPGREYRGVPIVPAAEFARERQGSVDALIVSNMSRVHAPGRAAAWRRQMHIPVIDLFSRQEVEAGKSEGQGAKVAVS